MFVSFLNVNLPRDVKVIQVLPKGKKNSILKTFWYFKHFQLKVTQLYFNSNFSFLTNKNLTFVNCGLLFDPGLKKKEIENVKVVWSCGSFSFSFFFTLLTLLSVFGPVVMIVFPESSDTDRQVHQAGFHRSPQRRLTDPPVLKPCSSSTFLWGRRDTSLSQAATRQQKSTGRSVEVCSRTTVVGPVVAAQTCAWLVCFTQGNIPTSLVSFSFNLSQVPCVSVSVFLALRVNGHKSQNSKVWPSRWNGWSVRKETFVWLCTCPFLPLASSQTAPGEDHGDAFSCQRNFAGAQFPR